MTELAYLDTARRGLLSAETVQAVTSYLDLLQTGTRDHVYAELLATGRTALGGVLGAPPATLAFTQSTTAGITQAAEALPLTAGDVVLLAENDHPAVTAPIEKVAGRVGAKVEWLPVEGPGEELRIGPIAERLGRGDVRVLASSWVRHRRGFRVDLQALGDACHANGALLVVDAMQGTGVIPIEVAALPIDVAAGATYKWLHGLEGLGWLYTAPSLALVDENGMPNMAGAVALTAALGQLAARGGVEAAWAHAQHLWTRAVEGLDALGAEVLSSRDVAHRSGILSFGLADQQPLEVHRALGEAGVICSVRGDALRLSLDGTTPTQHVDHLLETLATI